MGNLSNTAVAVIITLALAIIAFSGWMVMSRTAPAPAAAPAVAPAPTSQSDPTTVARHQAEAAALQRERDAAMLEAERARQELAAERVRRKAAERAQPGVANAAGSWRGLLHEGANSWYLNADGSFTTDYNAYGTWSQSGGRVTLYYQSHEGYRADLTISGDRMSGYEVSAQGDRYSMDVSRQ